MFPCSREEGLALGPSWKGLGDTRDPWSTLWEPLAHTSLGVLIAPPRSACCFIIQNIWAVQTWKISRNERKMWSPLANPFLWLYLWGGWFNIYIFPQWAWPEMWKIYSGMWIVSFHWLLKNIWKNIYKKTALLVFMMFSMSFTCYFFLLCWWFYGPRRG